MLNKGSALGIKLLTGRSNLRNLSEVEPDTEFQLPEKPLHGVFDLSL